MITTKNHWLILILLIGLSASQVNVSAQDSPLSRQSDNLIMVKLRPGESIDAINSRYGTKIVDKRLSHVNIYLLQPETTRSASNLRRDERVELVEFDKFHQMVDQLYADPSDVWAWGGYDPSPIDTQIATQMLGIRTAHTMSLGEGVTIAVLDTGVQLDHPYLSSRLVAGYDFVSDDDRPHDEWPDDRSVYMSASGHGTHVAGLIHFVAPKAEIMPIRILEPNGGGSLYDIVAGVHFAVENGADIINLSLGTHSNSVLLQTSLEVAMLNGVTVVAAAGNNANSEPQYPAAYEGVIGVASIDEEYALSPFSNYGDWVDLVAPGESAFSSFPTDGYAWWSGTSMATGFVSGQIALIAGAAPDIDLDRFLVDAAEPVDQQNDDFQNQLGMGIIDSGHALNLLGIEPLPTSD